MPVTYVPDLVLVPCVNSQGELVDVVNAALFGRHYVPEPFLAAGIQNPNVWGGAGFGPGYVGKHYLVQWYIENVDWPMHFYVVAGALPPGLALSDIGSNAEGQIEGIPTTLGDYTFTLLASG